MSSRVAWEPCKPMDIKEKLEKDPLFDVAILQHGFAAFMRDYDVIVEASGEVMPGRYRYRFTHCPVANVTTTVKDEVWRESWDDSFVDYNNWLAADEPPGFVWGVCWSMAYPGLTYQDQSVL